MPKPYDDGLLHVSLDGKAFLAHFEFQSSYDRHIGERLLEYNVLASRQYDYLPVYSCVIYVTTPHGYKPGASGMTRPARPQA
jgi:hypothetical protein